MAMWRAWLGAALLVGCAASKPPAQQAGSMAEEPPPKGAPPPRVGDLPPPPPARASETIDENERRFPIYEHRLRRERARRANVQVTERVEVRNDNPAQACDGLSVEERMECPLRDPRAVQSIRDLPRGVRVTLRSGATPPEKLQQQLACHQALAATTPRTGAPCAFMDAGTQVEVTGQKDGVEVDLERGNEVDQLRQQVRSALGKK